MAKKPYEFEERYSELEQELESRKSEVKRYYKICSKCGQLKMLPEFNLDKRSTDNRTGACRVCRSEQSLSYYYVNRDKKLIQIKEYQSTHKKERRSYFQNYRIANEEHLRKMAHKWYKKNRKRIKERDLKRKANLKG